MKRQLLIVLMAAFSLGALAQIDHQRVYSTFDNLPLSKSDTFNNGADSSGGFNHYGRAWNNSYNADWGSWSGWALSNMKDTVTAGFTNQYSAITGHGVSGTANYMVSTGNGAYIKLDDATSISGAYLTNATYTAREMEQGSGFSKKFGGDDGDDKDFLRVIISSYLSGDFVDSTVFYLADYRFADNSKDYIVKDWSFVDFNNDKSTDVIIDSISFRYEGSDVGEFGLNTPKYFCMDDFNAISTLRNSNHEVSVSADTFYNGSDNAGGISAGYLFFNNSFNSDWNSWSGWSLSSKLNDTTAGFGNQFSCINNSKSSFLVAGGKRTEIRSPYLENYKNSLFKTMAPAPWPLSFSITNSTYAALDMEQGSSFSKKFGGVDGNDPDYFRVLVNYVDAADSVLRVDTVYLADFRFEDNSMDYILKDWKEIKAFTPRDITFHKIVFNLESSDNGNFGMNTPAYFCLSYDFLIGSVAEINESINVLAYPNPTSSILNLQAEDVIENIRILSLDGRTLANGNTQVLSKNVTVNTAELASGVYFAVVTTAKGTVTKRFIKQ